MQVKIMKESARYSDRQIRYVKKILMGAYVVRVNQLAKELNITADTVRYYTKEGFLQPKKNHHNGYKEYSTQDLQRLRFIVCARQLGFTVKDIQEILDVADTGKTPCPLVRQLITERLRETEQHFENTARLRNRMQTAINDWNAKPDRAPTGHMICHLIEEFVYDS